MPTIDYVYSMNLCVIHTTIAQQISGHTNSLPNRTTARYSQFDCVLRVSLLCWGRPRQLATGRPRLRGQPFTRCPPVHYQLPPFVCLFGGGGGVSYVARWCCTTAARPRPSSCLENPTRTTPSVARRSRLSSGTAKIQRY